MKLKTYRQGDVLIEQIAKLPEKVKPVKRESGRVVLAHGEATGHHHSIYSSGTALMEAPSTERFLSVGPAGAALEHQEHATIKLPPGSYRVRRQREYSPEAIRNVQD
jgi:hypothetical protein